MGRPALLLVVACAACGRVNFDPRDVARDGDPIGDGSASLVTITAQLDGVAMPGELALFHDRDGTLLAEVRTDADGRASAAVPPGGSASWVVTLPIAGIGESLLIASVFDVQPGDDLLLAPAALAFATSEIDVVLPNLNGADTYQVQLPCGNSIYAGSGLRRAALRPGCAINGTYTALATALDVNGITIGSSLVTGVDINTTTINFPLWTTAFTPIAFSAPGLPVRADSCGIQAVPVFAGEIATDAAFDRRATAQICATGINLQIDPAIDDWVFNLAYNDNGNSFRVTTGELRRMSTPTMLIAQVDDYLPLYPELNLDTTGGRPAVDHAGPPAADADALHIAAAWLPVSNTGIVSWEVMMPPDHPKPYVVPELPASLATFAPDVGLGAALVVLESSDVAGYDDLRRRFGMLAFSRTSPLITSGKRLRVSRSRFETQ